MSRQSQKFSVAPDAKNISVSVNFCFGHFICRKKLLSVDFCFRRAQRKKKFGRRSFFLCAHRNSCFRQASRKIFCCAGLENSSVGGQLCCGYLSRKKLQSADILHQSAVNFASFAPIANKLRSAGICASVTPDAKKSGRFRRENTSIGGESCFSHHSCEINEVGGHFCFSQKFSVAPDAKKNISVSVKFCFGHFICKKKLLSADFCFRRAQRRKKFGRRSFFLCAHRNSCFRQASRKNFLSRRARKFFCGWSIVMCCGHLIRKKLRSADTLLQSAVILLRSRQSQINFGRRKLKLRSRQSQK